MHTNSQHISALYLERIQPVAPNNTQLSCTSRVAPKPWPAAPSAEPVRYPQESQQPWYRQLTPRRSHKPPPVPACNAAVKSLKSNLSLLPINTLGAPSFPLVLPGTSWFNFPPSPSHYSILSSHNIKLNRSKNKLLLIEMRNEENCFLYWKWPFTKEMLIKIKVPDQWHQMIIELLVK